MDEKQSRFDDASPLGDGKQSLIPAVLAGAVAAVAGGATWAVIVAVTGYEIGYAAVGIGLLVGFAMSHTTVRRETTVAALAALLALGGLITARLVIATYVMGGSSTVEEVLADPDLLVAAATLDLEIYGAFPADLQARYDAVEPDAFIPDDMYQEMLVAGSAHLDGLPDEARNEIAAQFVGLVMGEVNLADRIVAQLSLFDLLWLFLALSTAWKMVHPPAAQEALRQGETPPVPTP